MDIRTKHPWMPASGLEVGMYDEAAKKGMAFGEWLESLRFQHEGKSPYANMTQFEVIKAKNSAKAAGREAKLTAFDELMLSYGINIGGAAADTVGKFFHTVDAGVLMGEYISQVVAASLIATSRVNELVAVQERTDASSFQRIFLEDDGDDLELAEMAKSDELQDLWMKVGDRTQRLNKYGRYLKAKFDDVDKVTFQALNIVLRRIGMQIGVAETSTVIRVGVLGDGNSNAAATFNPTTTNTLDATQVIKLATPLANPYTPTHLIAKKAQMQQYLGAVVGINNPATTLRDVSVQLPKPIEWDRADAGLEADYIYLQDSNYCLGGVSTQAVMVESERLVKKQLKGTGIWYRSGYYKLDNNACKVMDVQFGG